MKILMTILALSFSFASTATEAFVSCDFEQWTFLQKNVDRVIQYYTDNKADLEQNGFLVVNNIKTLKEVQGVLILEPGPQCSTFTLTDDNGLEQEILYSLQGASVNYTIAFYKNYAATITDEESGEEHSVYFTIAVKEKHEN